MSPPGFDSNLMDLYQEVILDHCKRPRNFGPLAGADHVAEGYNPLCGDKVKVYVSLAGDRLAAVAFEGAGCAISTASASLMTEALAGKSREEAQRLFAEVHGMLTGDPSRAAAGEPPGKLAAFDEYARLGKLAALAGVREYPVRVKCATLAWHTLQAALAQRPGEPAAAVSTE
jgi:nitrogen fixation NifU-like protein